MTTDSGEPSSDGVLKLIARKIRSQILLFGLAIALVIVALIQVSGVDAALPIGAILVVFLVAAWVYAVTERSGAGERAGAAFNRDSPLSAVPDSKGEGLTVTVWVRRVEGGEREPGDFRLGDKVRVCARASRDCYLTLLNLTSDGELTILFPNRFNQNNRIQAGVTQEVPADGYGFDIRLEEPAGLDQVKAIVTLDPKPLMETQFSATGEFFHSVRATATPRAMRVVAAEVKKRDHREWAAASTQFLVKPS